MRREHYIKYSVLLENNEEEEDKKKKTPLSHLGFYLKENILLLLLLLLRARKERESQKSRFDQKRDHAKSLLVKVVYVLIYVVFFVGVGVLL